MRNAGLPESQVTILSSDKYISSESRNDMANRVMPSSRPLGIPKPVLIANSLWGSPTRGNGDLDRRWPVQLVQDNTYS